MGVNLINITLNLKLFLFIVDLRVPDLHIRFFSYTTVTGSACQNERDFKFVAHSMNQGPSQTSEVSQ